MPDVDAVSGAKGQRQWLILGVIRLAQLMVVLDATVMNIVLFRPGPRSKQGTPSPDSIGAVETAAEASPAISALSTGARR